MNISYDFTDKVAFVTGGTDGIGLACAQGFVDAGARVMVIGRNEERGAQAIAQLNAVRADAAIFVSADMGEANDIARCGRVCRCVWPH
jgi:NAD(P)-dependent dehydrogenase (short-subunit alcohol dehydrogenase family)